MKKQKLNIKGSEIALSSKNEDDFISLTDIAKYKNKESTGLVISHWLSAKYTVEFMIFWEQMHNLNFNITEFSNIRNEASLNGYVLSSKQWIEKINAIGIFSKPGRYGETFAHKD